MSLQKGGVTVEEESKQQDTEDKYEQAEKKNDKGKAKQYANSYDVGFIFDALWKKCRTDDDGKRIQV